MLRYHLIYAFCFYLIKNVFDFCHKKIFRLVNKLKILQVNRSAYTNSIFKIESVQLFDLIIFCGLCLLFKQYGRFGVLIVKSIGLPEVIKEKRCLTETAISPIILPIFHLEQILF